MNRIIEKDNIKYFVTGPKGFETYFRIYEAVEPKKEEPVIDDEEYEVTEEIEIPKPKKGKKRAKLSS